MRCCVVIGALASCLVAAPARAEANPWWFGAGAELSADSNVFRADAGDSLPPGRSRSDQRLSTSVSGGLDQPLGRGRLKASASLVDVRHARNDELDHLGYRVDAGLEWASVGRLSGDVTAQLQRALVTPGVDDTETGRYERNLATRHQAAARVQLGLVTRWSAWLEVDAHRVAYSNAGWADSEYRQSSLHVGLRYSPTALGHWGLGLRSGRTRYPRAQRLADGSEQADRASSRGVELRAKLLPGGVSEFDARIEVGGTDFDRARARNIDGVTGQVGWIWRPSGKLKLETRLQRRRGEDFDQRGLSLSSAQAVNETRTSDGLSVLLTHAWGAKLELSLRAAELRRDLVDTTSDAAGAQVTERGQDRSRLLAVGARWTPWRWIQLGCELSRESRRASGGLSSDFGVNVFSCNGQVTLQ